MSAILPSEKATHGGMAIQDRGQERDAFVRLDPSGFHIRHPPAPHKLDAYITPDDQLFQTIHMGAAVIDHSKYQIAVDGLVERPFAITLEELKRMPQTSITAFHECYGSPLKPPTEACLRIGNVKWTGVKLSYVLDLAGHRASKDPQFVWSEGLDRGSFAGVEADRYQKDLPMDKAMRPEVLVAYKMNDEALSKERGGPVRLVVPGYFGTNSTKWLCRLSIHGERAPGPYTTAFYNEKDSTDPAGQKVRPVWHVEVNSMITRPEPNEVVKCSEIVVEGWAWSDEGVEVVQVSGDGGKNWQKAGVQERFEYGWQRFTTTLTLPLGHQSIVARATSFSGQQQPLSGHRNHVHQIDVTVEES
jgi:DMSO/TMAO reductase YedYZ molybdopterin-dependent catalytic subunit